MKQLELNFKSEIFKDIKGYEGRYQISNYGRVKSLLFNKEKILKPYKSNSGYLIIHLRKNNNFKPYLISRLVGMHFVLNLEYKPIINHLDGIKLNNFYKNLEWATYLENSKHAWDNKLIQNSGRLYKEKNGHRECTDCGLLLPVSNFYLVYHNNVNKYFYHSKCKDCFK